MLEIASRCAGFARRYDLICGILKAAPMDELRRGNNRFLRRTDVAQLLTALVSSVYLDTYYEEYGRDEAYVAGYSMGQWTALYAAGSISFAQLAQILQRRSSLLDDCCRQERCGMIGVIGLQEDVVADACNQVRKLGHFAAISNYNCPGQYSVSGTEAALSWLSRRFYAMGAKRVVRLPVKGAWHGKLVEAGAIAFHDYIREIPIAAPTCPVIDNVSGDFLPSDDEPLKRQLGCGVDRAVQWEAGIRTLIDAGVKRFVEIGYGNTLTKFGFFVDRSVRHEAYLPRPLTVCS